MTDETKLIELVDGPLVESLAEADELRVGRDKPVRERAAGPEA